MVNNQRQYNSSVSRQTRVTSGMWLKPTFIHSLTVVKSVLSRITDGTLHPAAYIKTIQRYARYCDDCKLSMRRKLNGAIFTNMINNILSFVQVQHLGQLRIQDHVYIDPMKRHTKRLTTSIFAGRAAYGWIAEFHIDSVNSRCSTPPTVGLPHLEPTVRQIGSIKCHVSVNPTVQQRRVCDSRLMLKLSSLQCDDQSLRRYYCIDDVLAR